VPEWKIAASGKYSHYILDRDETFRRFQMRYGLTAEEIEELEELYSSASLFNFISHPALWKLSEEDYGA
jgi:hypothetical protein